MRGPEFLCSVTSTPSREPGAIPSPQQRHRLTGGRLPQFERDALHAARLGAAEHEFEQLAGQTVKPTAGATAHHRERLTTTASAVELAGLPGAAIPYRRHSATRSAGQNRDGNTMTASVSRKLTRSGKAGRAIRFPGRWPGRKKQEVKYTDRPPQ